MRKNVLISTHEFSPFQGSECSVGWNTVKELAVDNNVIVIYATTNQFNNINYYNDVHNFLNDNPTSVIRNVQLINIDQPFCTKIISEINKKIFGYRFSSIGLPVLYYIGYKIWQKKVYKTVKSQCIYKKVDLIHMLTSVTFREPGYLWKFDVPFIWGPTGGTRNVKYEFYKNTSFKNIVMELIRSFSNYFQFNFSRNIRYAIRHSSHIFLFDRLDKDKFRKKGAKSLSLMIDTGTYLENINSNITDVGDIVKILWVGQIVEFKKLDLLLDVLTRNEKIRKNIELTIIGDGPKTFFYKQMYNKLDDNVKWLGRVNHNEVFKFMKNSDILIHTSYREAASAVILEAISNGLVIMCHNISGMDLVVNDDCGFKIPFIDDNTSKDYIEKYLLYLIDNKNEIMNKKLNSLRRANDLTWHNKAKEITKKYYSV